MEVIAPPMIPQLISYPRTGSHWLRLFVEQYFDRPLLPKGFCEHPPEAEPLLEHSHDEDLDRPMNGKVIYLYRSVVNTVFSLVTFYHGAEAINLPWPIVEAGANHYRQHMHRWLLSEVPACDRHIVTYEWLLDRPAQTLSDVIRFLGGTPDPQRIAEIWPTITHDAVRERTTYDPRILRTDRELNLRRDLFRYRHGREIISLFQNDQDLAARMDPRLLA